MVTPGDFSHKVRAMAFRAPIFVADGALAFGLSRNGPVVVTPGA